MRIDAEIRWRRESHAYWMDLNPVLDDGEAVLSTDNGCFKLGDGETAWRDLPYFVPGAAGESDPTTAAALASHVESATPHPVYDDGPSLFLLYQNAKV